MYIRESGARFGTKTNFTTFLVEVEKLDIYHADL